MNEERPSGWSVDEMFSAMSKADIAIKLAHVGILRGDRAFLRASKALVRTALGRPVQPDETALTEMAYMLETGEAKSVEQAAGFAAAAMPGQQSFEATRTRLARKYRRNAQTKLLTRIIHD